MARTRDTPHQGSQHREALVNLTVQPTTQKTGPNKRSRKDDSADQPPIQKKSKSSISNPKRQREADNSPAEPDQETKSKKARTEKPSKNPQPQPNGTLQAPTRRSERSRTTIQVSPLKRTRRTKAQMIADKAKAEAEKLRLEELAQENRRAMLKMDIQEDISRAETAARTIKTFADIENESGEEFVGYDNIEDSELDGESEDAKTLKEANKALQKKIKDLEAQVDGGRREGLGGKKTSQTVAFASGLHPDWNSDDKAINYKGRAKKQTFVQVSVGGLDDSDTEDINPYISHSNSKATSRTLILTEDELTKGAQKATRDFSRQNELVSMALSDQEGDYTPHPATKKAAAKLQHPVRVKATKRSNGLPTVSVNTHKIPPSRIKTAASTALKPKSRRLNGNNVRMSDLPEFATERWRDTFLPTLYDKFFASDQPFDAFCKGSDRFIALLQAIIQEVYPDVKYKVIASDSIHFLAYNRINEKRSLIGSSAFTVLKNHVEGLNNEQAAKDWLRWARRVDGPLFFQVPSPIGSPINQGHPGYQYPKGRLLSPFIINLATSFLGFRTGAVSDNGFPKGLIALIMAALERAVKHLSKPSDKLCDFSKDHWGSAVGIYYDGFHAGNGVPDSRWKELVEACLRHSKDWDGDNSICDADLSILDNNRALVFDFCSPAKNCV